MDAQQHKRFLSYLELRDYFPLRDGESRLNAATFAEADTELNQLIAKEKRGEATAEEVRRMLGLRRLLLRD